MIDRARFQRMLVRECLLPAVGTAFFLAAGTPGEAQRPVTEFGNVRPVPNRVFGGVAITPADRAVQTTFGAVASLAEARAPGKGR